MADNRPRQRRSGAGISLQDFSFLAARGHEFQNEQGRDLPLSAAQQTPRNINEEAISAYRNAAPDPDAPPDLAALLYAMQGKVTPIQLSVPYTTAAQLILPAASRTYVFIQNIDLAATLWVGLGFTPDGVNSIGIKIAAGQAYEPGKIPQNDIWLAGSGAGVATILYAIG